MRRWTGVMLVAFVAGCGSVSPGTPDHAADPVMAEKTFAAKSGAPATPEQEAVLRLLEADKTALKAAFEKLTPESQPKALRKAIEEYVNAAAAIDTAGVPDDFKAAHAQAVNAWKKLLKPLAQLPDAYADTEFLDAIRDLFAGTDRFGRALGGPVMEAVATVLKADAAVRDKANAHGVTVSVGRL